MNAVELLTKQHRQMESDLEQALSADGRERHERFQRAAAPPMS
jgi:hypothetical protein